MNHPRAAAIAIAALSGADAAFAQGRHMMDDERWSFGWMGGFGGIWLSILLVIVAVGIVAWIVRRNR